MKECKTCGAIKHTTDFTKGKGECKDCRNYKRKDKYESERLAKQLHLCAICGYETYDKAFFEIHNQTVHEERCKEETENLKPKKVKCDLCGRYLMNINLEKHQKCKTCISVQNGERKPFHTIIRELK